MNTTSLKWLPLAALAFFFSSASPLAYANVEHGAQIVAAQCRCPINE